MNFLKTPQELLLEQAGIPHMAKGGSAMSLFSQLSPGAALVAKDLVSKATRMLGRAPNAQELAQIEQHAASLSKPTSTSSGMNLARAAEREPYANMFADEQGRVYSGFSDPKTKRLINPSEGQRNYLPFEKAFEPRDEFLTHQFTQNQYGKGRTNKGTSQQAFTTNIDDMAQRDRLAVGSPSAAIEERAPSVFQRSSEPSYNPHDLPSEMDDLPVSAMTMRNDVTPAASAFADMAAHPKASAIPHDYTGMGAAVMGDRPTFGAGTLTKAQKEELEKWRQLARDSGIPESAITSKPSRLGKQFQYLEKEHELGPAGPEAFMGGYAHGGTVTPREMLAEMTVAGHNVPHMAEGGLYSKAKDMVKPTWNKALTMLNLLEVPEIARAASHGKYAKAGEGIADTAVAFVPSMLGAAGYYGGKLATNTAGNMLRDNPAHQAQMEAMGSDELGGALTGDAALAAHILKNSR